ncbi:MAG: hypothetical protein MRJ52_02630 [Nitrosomonas sp.]|nr:hypothetical protein [Nitrosomonas sp.]
MSQWRGMSTMAIVNGIGEAINNAKKSGFGVYLTVLSGLITGVPLVAAPTETTVRLSFSGSLSPLSTLMMTALSSVQPRHQPQQDHH